MDNLRTILVLAVPAFISGMLTFLAACTVTLIPGYLAFMAGISKEELNDMTKRRALRFRVLKTAALYVLGFSAVFVLFGSLLGWGGQQLSAYRTVLSRVGGVFVIFFGLFTMGVLNEKFMGLFARDRRLHIGHDIEPGKPLGALLLGLSFGFAWIPCATPLLAAVLLLASKAATVGTGAILLAIFSLGLGIPMLLVSFFLVEASEHINIIRKYQRHISVFTGIFLVVLGTLLVFEKTGLWTSLASKAIKWTGIERFVETYAPSLPEEFKK